MCSGLCFISAFNSGAEAANLEDPRKGCEKNVRKNYHSGYISWWDCKKLSKNHSKWITS